MMDHRATWDAKLRPLHLDGEPLGRQLEKRRGVLTVLSMVCCGVTGIVVALFTAFGRFDIGAILGLIFLGPVLSIAWYDFVVLRRHVIAYLTHSATRRT